MRDPGKAPDPKQAIGASNAKLFLGADPYSMVDVAFVGSPTLAKRQGAKT
jgi:hypothetical protein